MNSVYKGVMTVSAALFSSALMADGWVFFDRDGDWRVSGGFVFDIGVKTRLRTSVRPKYVSPFSSGDTAEDAKAKAEGVLSGTRRTYPNGSWIDMNDPGIEGDMPGNTGHYCFRGEPGVANLGSVFSLGSASYSEVTVNGGSSEVAEGEHDKAFVPGFSIELARPIYCDSERNWGVDLAFALQYFYRRSAYRSDMAWQSSSTVREGTYSSTIDTGDVYAGDDPNEDWNWRSDASGSYYGSGEPDADGYYGYAGPINGGAVNVTHVGGSRTDVSSGSLHARGDYENLEFLLTLRPYYDVTDWLRLVGTVGVGVSRQNLDFTATIMQDGSVTRYNRDFSDWDCYGVAGLGAVLTYRDFSLGVDFLARFLNDDLDVRCDYAEGGVSRGAWMCRVMFGYTF